MSRLVLPTMSLLTVRDVRVQYGTESVLTDVNFQVEIGDWLHVTGDNGAGKTTLLDVLASFRRPDDGVVLWKDKSIWEQLEEYRRSIRYIGHQESLFDDLTVRDNWQLYEGLFGGGSPEERLMEDIPWKRKVKHLSQGQRMRLQLATAMNTEREIILLDEPMQSLDAKGESALMSVLRSLTRDGTRIISTSPSSMEGPDRVLQLEDGVMSSST